MTEGRVWLRQEPMGSPGILALEEDEDLDDEEWEEDDDDWDDDDEDEDDWEEDDDDDDWDDWDEDDEETDGRQQGRPIWNRRAA